MSDAASITRNRSLLTSTLLDMKTLSLAGINSSSDLARLLHANSLVRRSGKSVEFVPPPSGLQVDFSGVGRLGLSDTCLLLLMVRRTAEAESNVQICWPTLHTREETKRRHFLARIGFASALRGSYDGQEWKQRVAFIGNLGPEANDWPQLEEETSTLYARSYNPHHSSYLRLSFFDKSSFRDVTDFWRARPFVKPVIAHRLRGMLNRGGYLDQTAINALIGTLFLELGWNTVLHADVVPGEGYGVFCAQIRPERNVGGDFRQDLQFCVADLGLGIPVTLGPSYRKNLQKLKHDHEKFSYATRTILYSLQPEGSRRLIHVSDSDQEAYRGLSHVADLLGVWGDIEVRAAGGAVRLGRDMLPSGVDTLYRIPLPGTQIAGVLRERVVREVVTYTTARLDWSDDVSIVQVVSHSGEWLGIETQEEANSFVRGLTDLRNIVVFDCGYNSTTITQIQYLLKAAIEYLRKRQIVLWNVTQEWPLFHHLAEWIPPRLGASQMPPLVVRGLFDAALIGRGFNEALEARFAKALGLSLSKEALFSSVEICTAQVPTDTYYGVTKLVNTSYIKSGFEIAGPEEGFFEGRIHLMAGQTVGKFFALLRHLEVSEDHVMRWSTTIATQLKSWISETDQSGTPVTIIGFAYPVRGVIDTLSRKLLRDVEHSSYTLLSYDVPTEEELGSIVAAGHRVYLITDVISSGSLVRAVEAAVVKNGGDLQGLVALVDARTGTLDLGSPRFFTLSEMTGGSGKSEDKEMWVDPVSMIPMDSTVWETHHDPRVDETVSLLVRSGAAQCGHYIDGTRHSSLMVDVGTLVDRVQFQILERVSTELQIRLSRRGWTDFNPTHKVFPAGIGRIEPIRERWVSGVPLTTYATAVRHVSALIDIIWPGAATEVEVPRVFDPDGRPRCAVAVPPLPRGGDVLIVDDGMWSGQTSIALVRSAAAAGASRICILPLIARMSASDLSFWEGLQQLGTTALDQPIPVCFVFPLFLPIPYFNAQSCPYDVTLTRFRHWLEHDEFVSVVARKVAAPLRARRASEGILRSPRYMEAWLTLRTSAELASENQSAFEMLQDRIAEIDSVGDPEALHALFSLFLEEWRILSRPRLRQIVSPQIEAIASAWVRSPDLPTHVRQSAISLLRSLYPKTFIEELDNLVQDAGTDPETLERCLFHAFTLRDELRRDPQVRRAARNVLDVAIPSHLHEELNSEREEELTRTRFLATKLLAAGEQVASRLELQSAAEDLLRIYRDFVLSHRTTRRLQTLIGWERKDPGTLKSEAFTIALADWREEILYLEREVVPRVAAIRAILLDGRRRYLPLDDSSIRYLLTAENGGRRGMLADFSAVDFLLERLAASPNQVRLISQVSGFARQIHDVVVEPNCTTHLLIGYHFSQTTQTLLDSALQEIALLETPIGIVEIEADIDDRIDLDRHVFCPEHIWSYCLASVSSNLRQHAFVSTGSSVSPQVLIRVGITARRKRSMVVFSFLNNGLPLGVASKRVGSIQHVNSVAAVYGTQVAGCFNANEPPWTAVTQVLIPFSNLRS